jgi:hypothetical protein
VNQESNEQLVPVVTSNGDFALTGRIHARARLCARSVRDCRVAGRGSWAPETLSSKSVCVVVRFILYTSCGQSLHFADKP